MAKRRYILYYDVSTRKVYDETLENELGNDAIPYLAFKEECEVEWHLLNSKSLTDVYTGFDGVTISPSMAVDDSYAWYAAGTLTSGLTAATPYSTVTVSGLESAPRAAGKIVVYTSAGLYETIYYNQVTASGSNYVFRCSDSSYVTAAFTPTNTYALGDTARVHESPYLKAASADIDQTDKATGVFIVSLDGDNSVFESAIQGRESISAGLYGELKVLDGSANLLLVARVPFRLDGLLDNDSPDQAPSPVGDYYTADEMDGFLAAKADLLGSEDIEITDTTKGIILSTAGGRRARVTLYDDAGTLSLNVTEIV
jgi:hypothetical protein